ncbi:MAG TPA: DUF4255 domain-containing protein [Nostocaceae cyanobacterium]|nr:DUF4255 domain-containing protein [Nostocaceae cyanobacterium]
MSNDVAIATVTATLKYILEEGVTRNGGAVEVTTLPPNTEGEGIPKLGVNLYLYRITPNMAMANSDLRPLRPKGELIKKFHSALDLHYLITFYGNDAKLEAQKLSGLVIRTLADNPILTPELITRALALSTDPDLGRSDLMEQTDRVRVTPNFLTNDELSKIWSTLVQTPYRLCLAYQASMVLLEGTRHGEVPLPLRERRSYLIPNQPVIERVLSDAGQWKPILANSTLLIQGKQLAGVQTWVQLGSQKFSPQNVTDTEVTLSLAEINPEDLRAGIQSVQIVHFQADTPEPLPAVESNVVAFVLCPAIESVGVENLQMQRRGTRDGQITLELNMQVGTTQRVLLLLNEVPGDSGDGSGAYIFKAEKRTTETRSPVFLCQNVKVGTYLVRVQVDGAASQLKVDNNPESPTFDQYNEPLLVIE